MRALAAAMLDDPALAAEYRERLEAPMKEFKRARLASARDAGQLPADVDLDLAVDLLWSPLRRRWQLGGELTPEFSDAVVETVLAGLRSGSGAPPGQRGQLNDPPARDVPSGAT